MRYNTDPRDDLQAALESLAEREEAGSNLVTALRDAADEAESGVEAIQAAKEAIEGALSALEDLEDSYSIEVEGSDFSF